MAACLLFTLPTACRGGSGALDGEQGIPTPCESGKASNFPETKLRLSTAPFSLPVSISHTGLSSPGMGSPDLCPPHPTRALAAVPTGVCDLKDRLTVRVGSQLPPREEFVQSPPLLSQWPDCPQMQRDCAGLGLSARAELDASSHPASVSSLKWNGRSARIPSSRTV